VVRSEPFDFAGARATVRDFPPGTICEAEPRFLLDELSSVHSLLNSFLRKVPGGTEDEAWPDAAIALAEEASSRLPPLLDLHGRSLATAAGCEFSKLGAWPTLLGRGRELLHEVKARLESAPAEIAQVRQARAMAQWHQERLAQQDSARRACPRKPGAAIVYFAWREGGLTTWLFCDGARLTRDGQQRPELEPAPAELLKGKRPSESAYQSAAGRYPAGAVLDPCKAEGVVCPSASSSARGVEAPRKDSTVW
jgi:hypothetical protein